MLKMKYLTEDFALARQALIHWAHDEATLAQRLSWFRISSNAVYPFDRAGKLAFLRLAPAEEKNRDELLGELDFLQFLQQRGFPALRPIPADSGELLLTIDAPDGPWYACAFTCVPGQPLEDLPMNSSIAYAYGAALGHLHRESMAYRPPMPRRSHADALAWIRSSLRDGGAPESLLQQTEEVARLLEALPRTPACYGLIHYDFEPDNVFWDGRSCHAIDFEDGMLHFFAMDAVQALDKMDDMYHADFLGGYHDACPEAQLHQADFPLMRRFRDLFSYARLLHCLSATPEAQPDWMQQLISRLQGRLQELEQTIADAP